LLKFAKDRNRRLQWLFEARRRYGLAAFYLLADERISKHHAG
jgi:hypothetical protein